MSCAAFRHSWVCRCGCFFCFVWICIDAVVAHAPSGVQQCCGLYIHAVRDIRLCPRLYELWTPALCAQCCTDVLSEQTGEAIAYLEGFPGMSSCVAPSLSITTLHALLRACGLACDGNRALGIYDAMMTSSDESVRVTHRPS